MCKSPLTCEFCEVHFFLHQTQSCLVRVGCGCSELSVSNVSRLDDGDGVLTFSEFCEGIPKIRGPARSLDIIALQRLGRAFLERSEGEGD